MIKIIPEIKENILWKESVNSNGQQFQQYMYEQNVIRRSVPILF
jgi:hypothetical protein